MLCVDVVLNAVLACCLCLMFVVCLLFVVCCLMLFAVSVAVDCLCLFSVACYLLCVVQCCFLLFGGVGNVC